MPWFSGVIFPVSRRGQTRFSFPSGGRGREEEDLGAIEMPHRKTQQIILEDVEMYEEMLYNSLLSIVRGRKPGVSPSTSGGGGRGGNHPFFYEAYRKK